MVKTITLSINSLFQPSESSILVKLQENLPDNIIVYSVDRPLFSGRFIVSLADNFGYTDSQLRFLILDILAADYEAPEIVEIAGGANNSSLPGGIASVAETATKATTSIAIIAVIVGIIYLESQTDILKGIFKR